MKTIISVIGTMKISLKKDMDLEEVLRLEKFTGFKEAFSNH